MVACVFFLFVGEGRSKRVVYVGNEKSRLVCKFMSALFLEISEGLLLFLLLLLVVVYMLSCKTQTADPDDHRSVDGKADDHLKLTEVENVVGKVSRFPDWRH